MVVKTTKKISQLQATEMTSYRDLMAQVAALQERAEAARLVEFEAMRAEIRENIAAFGMTVNDLFDNPQGQKKKIKHVTKNPVLAKYRNPSDGATWTGRGKVPAWLKNVENRDEFLIRE